MLYAGIDIQKAVFQVVVLDPDSGELSESRFEPSRERLNDWAIEWQGRLAAVAIEATTGWRWVARELQARGLEVHLVDPGRASALRGRRRQPKTDRLDARWLALLLARELVSECEAWLPPAAIQRLRDQTRLRKALAGDRTGWAQRLHALLAHEGWPCSRGRLLTAEGRRWLDALELDAHVRARGRRDRRRDRRARGAARAGRPRRPPLRCVADDLRGRPDPRLPVGCANSIRASAKALDQLISGRNRACAPHTISCLSARSRRRRR
jgi:transposase